MGWNGSCYNKGREKDRGGIIMQIKERCQYCRGTGKTVTDDGELRCINCNGRGTWNVNLDDSKKCDTPTP